MFDEVPNLITWDAGKIMIFGNSADLQDALTKYFRTGKFTSFQRQLNNFGFHKKISESNNKLRVYVRNDMLGYPPEALLELRRMPGATFACWDPPGTVPIVDNDLLISKKPPLHTSKNNNNNVNTKKRRPSPPLKDDGPRVILRAAAAASASAEKNILAAEPPKDDDVFADDLDVALGCGDDDDLDPELFDLLAKRAAFFDEPLLQETGNSSRA